MRTYTCTCGNRLFFENTRCLNCCAELAFCPHCRRLAPIVLQTDGLYCCQHADCRGQLIKCDNYARHQVCNRAIRWFDGPLRQRLCDCCCYNEVIPDLTVSGNHGRWYRLEIAKRRLCYGLDLIGLPRDSASGAITPPLTFQFLADIEAPWHAEAAPPALTGHRQGRITINIREADDDERERLRVQFGETHRTLIGHFRHEIGHYYWEALIHHRMEHEFKAVFGDHEQIGYDASMERHYQSGPRLNWQQHFISAYASMYPFEDFAETFAAYLGIVCLLDSARHHGFRVSLQQDSFDAMVSEYRESGIAMNEMNRSMGLVDLVPEVRAVPVIEKLRFVHDFIRRASYLRGT